MKLDKFALVLLITLVIGGAALYFSQQEVEQHVDKEAGNIFSTALMQRINEVATVKIQEKDSVTTLALKNDQWGLTEKAGYPADFSKVKKLIIDISEFKTIESKTSNPEKYGRLGVQDINESGEVASKKIDFLDKAGNIIESIILGKNKVSKTPGSGNALYVRKTNDAKSWLVSGSMRLPTAHIDWLDKKIVDIKSAEISKVTISHPDKSQLIVEKATKEDKHFKVVNLPKAASLKSESVADSLANALQNLTFNDVLPRKEFTFGKAKPTVAEYSTFDGMNITAKVVEKDEKHFVVLDANSVKDESKEKAIKLGTHFAQWAFEVASFKADNMRKKLDDLVAKPEQPAKDE